MSIARLLRFSLRGKLQVRAILILVALLVSSSALAESWTVINLRGPYSITQTEFATAVWPMLIDLHAGVKDKPSLTSYSEIYDSSPVLYDANDGDFMGYYSRVKAYISKYQYRCPQRIGQVCMFLIPPMQVSGKRYIGGLAMGLDVFSKSVAFANGQAWSTHNPPRDRLYMTALAMAHEVGHTRCYGRHDSGVTIMTPAFSNDMADVYRGKIYYSSRAKAAFKRCTAQRKKIK